MTLQLRRTWAPLLLLAIVSGVAGCNQPESGTRNIVEGVAVNDNNPLFSSVYDRKDIDEPNDDTVPTDVVTVVFQSRRNDNVLTTVGPGQPFGSVRFTSYDLIWQSSNPDGIDLDGNGSVDLVNTKGGAMNAVVATGSTASASIVVVTPGTKVQAPLSCLGPIGSAEECSENTAADYRVNANLVFYGTEETSGTGITLSRGLTVVFGQYDSQ